jgi:hypothetical protein
VVGDDPEGLPAVEGCPPVGVGHDVVPGDGVDVVRDPDRV